MDFRIIFTILYFFILSMITEAIIDIEKRPLLLVEEGEPDSGMTYPKYKNIGPDTIPDVNSDALSPSTIYDTSYISYPKNKIDFFCLAEEHELEKIQVNSNSERCLFSQWERENDSCKEEIKPTAEKAMNGDEHITCKMWKNQEGKLYNVGYKCCNVKMEVIHFHNLYDLCYDDKSKRTLFIRHQIYVPQFLNFTVFQRDREWYTENPETDNYNLFGNDFIHMKNKMESNPLQWMPHDDDTLKGVSFMRAPLASPYDMAILQWKKPFFHYSNIVLIRKEFYTLWGHIHNYIRSLATNDTSKRIITSIYSGATYDPSMLIVDPHLFWFLILGTKENPGIALIIHNSDPNSTSPPIKPLCNSNAEHFTKAMNEWHDVPENVKKLVYSCNDPKGIIKPLDF